MSNSRAPALRIGQANLSFILARPASVEAHLRAASASLPAGVDAAALDSCVVARTVDDHEARIAVHVPAAGEYTLEVFTCDPQRDGDRSLAYQYLLHADSQSPVRSGSYGIFNLSLVLLDLLENRELSIDHTVIV